MIHIEILENDSDTWDVIVNGVFYQVGAECSDEAFEWAKVKAEAVKQKMEAEKANTLKDVFDTLDEIFRIRK